MSAISASAPIVNARARRRAVIEALVVSAVTLCSIVVALLGLWLTATSTARADFERHLVGLAEAAASVIDVDRHAGIRTEAQRNNEDYTAAVVPLRRLRDAVPEIHYIYTVRLVGTEAHFVLDATEPGTKRADGGDDQAQVGDRYEQSDPAMSRALGVGVPGGFAAATSRPYTDRWGTFMTGWAPIRDRTGRAVAAVGVDVTAETYLAALTAARERAILGLLPSVLLVMTFGYVFYRTRFRGLHSAETARRSGANARATAARLTQEQQKLQRVMSGAQVGTWESDLVAQTFIADGGLITRLGYDVRDPPEATIRAWRALVHPDDIAELNRALDAAAASDDPGFVVEVRMRRVDDTWIWVQTRGRILERTADGRIARMAGIHVDVTARMAVEEALRANEQSLRSLFELAPIGIALIDAETRRFLRVNPAMVQQTGYREEEILTRCWGDVIRDRSDGSGGLEASAEASATLQRSYEADIVRADGMVRQGLLAHSWVTDPDGRAVVWSIIQDITARKANERALAFAATRDRLTGLVNRAAFMGALEQSLADVRAGRQRHFAVLFLDFDRFKVVNDTFGHTAGDDLLRQITARLLTALRGAEGWPEGPERNIVGRFGGDEFLILLNDLRSADDATIVAERLLNRLAEPYSVAGHDIHSTASIGIVTSGFSTSGAEEIVRNADVAMYEAKRRGRACTVVFNEAMHATLARSLTLESALRRAIGSEEMQLAYQPIVELKSGKVTSAEALLRWNHPELGAISPAEFIPVAEDTGLIVPLGAWVLQEACRTFAAWRAAGRADGLTQLSVNVSKVELGRGRAYVDTVLRCLAEHGLPPDCLQLEVTEREVMRNPEEALVLLGGLSAAGVRLAMDDFGTGTSSLGFLREFPFHTIKVDRSFVEGITENPDVLSVIHATLALIDNLGKVSVAEGIESAAQVAVLQALGCHYAQGYYFGRPMAAAAFLEALEARG